MSAPTLLAASTTAVVWLVVGLVSTAALIAMLVALVRHVLVIGRAIGRFQEEITPIADEISAASPSVPRPGTSGPRRR